MKKLKSVLKFWQEIVFIASIGFPLTAFTNDLIIHGRTLDGYDILCLCFLLPVFICLIGQFFWKNGTLSIFLAAILFLYSLFWIFVSFAMPNYITHNVPNPNNYLRPVILIGALFLVFASITMPKKYFKNNTICTLNSTVSS